jgi:hypothetical protein
MYLSSSPAGDPTPTPADLNTCLAVTFPGARHIRHDEVVIDMNEVRERASDLVQRAAIRFKAMIDGPGQPTGRLAISGGDTTMLKIISAALLAASVLVAAPAMAHSPGRTAHGPGIGTVYVHPGVFGANARMGRHHYRYHHRHHRKHFRHHHRFHRYH